MSLHSGVSAIIPTHRRPTQLRDAVRSVQIQTRACKELIIVDDVGDPSTEAVVADLVSASPLPIEYLHNKAAPGAYGSRNLGAAHASCGAIAFLDDDDVWLPNFLELTYARLCSTDADIVLGGIVEVMPPRPRRLRLMPEGLDVESFFTVRGGMTGSNALYRSQKCFAVGGFDVEVAVFNDWNLLFRMVLAGASYAVVKEPLVEWRRHDRERIGTPSLHRADGIDAFERRYRAHMPRALRRELRATATGIRRRLAISRHERLISSLRLACIYGFVGCLDRISRRRSGRSSGLEGGW